jgi:hypothetical protein
MTERRRAETADGPSPFSGLIERMVAFRIELAGLDLSALTEKECAVLGEQCERLVEQLEAMLAHLATFETETPEKSSS